MSQFKRTTTNMVEITNYLVNLHRTKKAINQVEDIISSKEKEMKFLNQNKLFNFNKLSTSTYNNILKNILES
jgi:hypothetical protein